MSISPWHSIIAAWIRRRLSSKGPLADEEDMHDDDEQVQERIQHRNTALQLQQRYAWHTWLRQQRLGRQIRNQAIDLAIVPDIKTQDITLQDVAARATLCEVPIAIPIAKRHLVSPDEQVLPNQTGEAYHHRAIRKTATD